MVPSVWCNFNTFLYVSNASPSIINQPLEGDITVLFTRSFECLLSAQPVLLYRLTYSLQVSLSQSNQAKNSIILRVWPKLCNTQLHVDIVGSVFHWIPFALHPRLSSGTMIIQSGSRWPAPWNTASRCFAATLGWARGCACPWASHCPPAAPRCWSRSEASSPPSSSCGPRWGPSSFHPWWRGGPCLQPCPHCSWCRRGWRVAGGGRAWWPWGCCLRRAHESSSGWLR